MRKCCLVTFVNILIKINSRILILYRCIKFLYVAAAHNKALADINVASSSQVFPGLITESTVFLNLFTLSEN